jgi:hypothetical protein
VRKRQEQKEQTTLRAQLKGQQMLWRFVDSIYKRLPADRVEMVKSGKGFEGGIILLRKIEHTKEICKGGNGGGEKEQAPPQEEVGATKSMASMKGC